MRNAEAKVEQEQHVVKNNFWSYLKTRELNEYPNRKLQWFLLVLLFVAWTAEQFQKAKMSPVLIFLLEDFQIPLQTWGYIAATGTLISAIFTYYFGSLADRFGRKRMILWPIFIYIFISFGTALAPNLFLVATLYILGFVVIAAGFPAISAAVRDFSPKSGRAISYAVINLAFLLGVIISNSAAAAIIPVFPGWRPQFWLAGAVGAIIFIIFGYFYRDLSKRLVGNKGLDKNVDQQYKAIHKDLRIWAVALANGFWVLVYITIVQYVPLYFANYFGMKPEQAASMSNVFFIVFAISCFISGWMSDKLQLRKIFTVVGGIIAGGGLIFLSTVSQDISNTSLIIIWAIIGYSAGLISPIWYALLSENAEAINPNGVARAFAIAAVLLNLFQVLLNLGLPIVVAKWDWSAWIFIAGLCCFMISVCNSFGRGPWLARK